MRPPTLRSILWLPPGRRLWPTGCAGIVAPLVLVLGGLGAPPAWAVAASAGAATAAAPPSDLTRQQVRQLVHEAGQLMDRGDRAGAAARLQQAQALWPDPSLDYNLGIVYAELGQHPQAAQALGRFLAAADRTAVLGERLEDARHRVDEYQRTLARLQIHASVPPQAGAPSLMLDEDKPGRKVRPAAPGSPDATSEFPSEKPLWLEPGPHKVRVAARGARDYTVQIDLHPGELRQLYAELVPLAQASTLVPSSLELRHADDSSSVYKKWWFWTAVGGGGAAVLSVAIGLIAAGATGKLSHTAAGSDLAPVDVSR